MYCDVVRFDLGRASGLRAQARFVSTSLSVHCPELRTLPNRLHRIRLMPNHEKITRRIDPAYVH